MRRSARPEYIPKQKACAFCADKVDDISYRDPALLRRYISDRCKIQPRRRSGNCAKHQRALAQAIKRARHIALLPHVQEQIRRVGVTGLR
jgi:small subunit ribosomal protein S18